MAAPIVWGWPSHNPVEFSMSVRHTVSTPAGMSASHPARSSSTSSPAEEGRRAGSVAAPARMARSNTRRRSASIPVGQAGPPAPGMVPVSRAYAVTASA